jgi:hypothetical protein
MTLSAVRLLGLLLIASTSAAAAVDTDALKDRMKNGICPRPAVTYDLETHHDICGEPPGSSNETSRWQACSSRVNRDNDVIAAYNQFVQDQCAKPAL